MTQTARIEKLTAAASAPAAPGGRGRVAEEAEVELGAAAAAEGGAVRVEDVEAHLGDARGVVADDVAQVPRLKMQQTLLYVKAYFA